MLATKQQIQDEENHQYVQEQQLSELQLEIRKVQQQREQLLEIMKVKQVNKSRHFDLLNQDLSKYSAENGDYKLQVENLIYQEQVLTTQIQTEQNKLDELKVLHEQRMKEIENKVSQSVSYVLKIKLAVVEQLKSKALQLNSLNDHIR